MDVIEETIGNSRIYIQVVNDVITVDGESIRATQPTGIDEQLTNAFAKLKSFLNDVAADIGDEFDKIDGSFIPKNVELEFNVGFTIGGDIICISAEGESGVSVKMVWDLIKD